MAAVVTTGIVLTLLYLINGKNLKSTVVFSPEELVQDNLANNSFKFALRYGFQRTSECKDFSKAFICIQKCKDLGFDVAHSNKHCFCTCYHKRGKPKSTISKTFTKWRLGAPTTKLPPWASTDGKSKQNDIANVQYVMQDGNLTDIVFDVQTENTTLGKDTLSTGGIANSTGTPGQVNGTDTEDDGNATSVTKDNSTQTGETGAPNAVEKVTGTGAENVTGAGAENVTGAGAENVTGAGAENVTGAGAENVTGAGAENVTGADAGNYTGTGAAKVTGVEKVTGTGKEPEGTQNPSASNVTNISGVVSNNTGGTENPHPASQPVTTMSNQSNTEKPKGGTGVTT